MTTSLLSSSMSSDELDADARARLTARYLVAEAEAVRMERLIGGLTLKDLAVSMHGPRDPAQQALLASLPSITVERRQRLLAVVGPALEERRRDRTLLQVAVEARREQQGWSHAEVAGALGVDPKVLKEYERGSGKAWRELTGTERGRRLLADWCVLVELPSDLAVAAFVRSCSHADSKADRDDITDAALGFAELFDPEGQEHERAVLPTDAVEAIRVHLVRRSGGCAHW